MNDRLYVGNLSFHTSEDALRDAFGEFGSVMDAKVIMDRETGRSRGFGFVTMDSGDAATKAIEGMDGTVLDGRPLRVNVAEERGGGGRGRGRGGPRGGGGGGRPRY